MVYHFLSDRCPVCPVGDVGVLWPNGWMDQYATWYGGRPRPRSLAPWKGAQQLPTFTIYGCRLCLHPYNPRPIGQMTGWIKTPLGAEVGLSSGYIVLDADPAPPKGA